MSVVVLTISLFIVQIALAVSMCFCVYRLARGPRAQDRILGLDALYVCAMLEMLTFGIRTGRSIYFEAALVVAVLGFVATVSLAKFLMRGEVIE